MPGERELQVRFARHTERLDELVRFYRDGLGLPEIGRFANHDEYDGVFLALPGASAHLEFTSGYGHEPPEPHPETLLVLYLGSREAVEEACARLGTDPVCESVLEATRRHPPRPGRPARRPGSGALGVTAQPRGQTPVQEWNT